MLASALRRLLGAGPPSRSQGMRPLERAAADFAIACPLLEMHEQVMSGRAATAREREELLIDLSRKWASAPVSASIPFANDSMTIQLSELFQHLHDVDSGDTPLPSLDASSLHRDGSTSAAFTPSIGPSSHTNPHPTLPLQMKALFSNESIEADIRLRRALTGRAGFSLWLGPSQAPTATHKAGVYLQGRVPAGSVVALVPGAAYNGDMRLRASDSGSLRNPRVPRVFVHRFDDCLLDVHAPEAAAAAARNPYALGQHIRAAPPSIFPNVMRLQYDFVAGEVMGGGGGSAAASAGAAGSGTVMPFPAHLRDYIPNVWGAEVSVGQELFGALEQNIFAKAVACVALRPLWDEELFVGDAPYAPTNALPAAQAAARQLPAASSSDTARLNSAK